MYDEKTGWRRETAHDQRLQAKKFQELHLVQLVPLLHLAPGSSLVQLLWFLVTGSGVVYSFTSL